MPKQPPSDKCNWDRNKDNGRAIKPKRRKRTK